MFSLPALARAEIGGVCGEGCEWLRAIKGVAPAKRIAFDVSHLVESPIQGVDLIVLRSPAFVAGNGLSSRFPLAF